jgi:IS4 transposase
MTDADDWREGGQPDGDDENSTIDLEANPEEVIIQADTLFGIHDNISRVIKHLDLPVESLPDNYNEADKSDGTFDFEAMLRVFLYRYIGDYSQNQVSSRLDSWPYLRERFGLNRPPTQQVISHTERNRFPLAVRRFLRIVAEGIQTTAADHNIQSNEIAPADQVDPAEIDASDQPLYKYVDRHAPQLISEVVSTVTPAFDSGRGANKSHEDKQVWKQQTAMSLMDRAGTPSAFRTFNKFKRNPAHNDTHVNAVKKLGTPSGYQSKLDDYNTTDGSKQPIPAWRRIADTIQSQFSDAIQEMLSDLRRSEMFTEPVVAAIDTTSLQFHVSPWKSDDDIEGDDERIYDGKTGREKVPKDDYPEMVNGTKEKNTYAYQYATLTIVGLDVPLVVAVEPVRHDSTWEGDDGESVSWAEVVDRLMEQATDILDIHLVMADRAFDQPGVYHVLDQRHDVDYLIPKKEDSKHLRNQAAEVREDPAVRARVEQEAPLYLHDETPYINVDTDSDLGENGHTHDVTLMHVPADRDDWILRHANDTGYAIFATNRTDVTPMDAEGLTNRYSDRWDIEIEYKMIQPLVPSISSTDYRMRFFSFVFSCLLYNLWRVVDHSLKDLASEAFPEYGRGPHEERLDPLLTLADFLTSSLILLFRDTLDPPDIAV